MNIEVVDEGNLDKVLPLVREYQVFYGAHPNSDRNRSHFSRLIKQSQEGMQFLALDGNRAVGFATLYFPLSTLSASRGCVLNDLYTVEEYRGQGVGKSLMCHCSSFARLRGFSKMSWQTQTTNLLAQRLYNSLPASKEPWLGYELALRENADRPIPAC